MEKTCFYKGATIHYTELGKGSAVVLLHGFLENRSMWDFILEDLAARYRVFAIDLLGHGASDSVGYIHTMEDQADMVYTILNESRIRKASIIGHSMGGYIALAFAEYYPDNIRKIVLLNSTARPDSDERKANRDRALLAVKQNFPSFVRMSISNLFSEKNRTLLTNEIEAIKTQALMTSLQGVTAALEGMKIRKDREVLLHFAPYPIMLILGTDDPVLPFEDTRTQIEGTSTVFYALNGGHMSHIENVDQLNPLLLKFLKT